MQTMTGFFDFNRKYKSSSYFRIWRYQVMTIIVEYIIGKLGRNKYGFWVEVMLYPCPDILVYYFF